MFVDKVIAFHFKQRLGNLWDSKKKWFILYNKCFHLINKIIHIDLKPFWLAVHGKPVLFWKGISGLKFPCFLFVHAKGTGPFEFRAVPIL